MMGRTHTICLVIIMVMIIFTMGEADDDNAPLIQPDIYESPCVQKWKEMSAHFALDHPSQSRPLMYEHEPSLFHVNLTVVLKRFESRYIGFNTRSFNGKIPAPTIKVCPGDTLVINLRNSLEPGEANRTNLHLHGLHVRPNGNHDNVLPSIEPGAERTYKYHIRPDHPSGSFWYHPHSHGMINSQLSGLMAGSLIVVDRPHAYPQAIARMDDLLLILQGICINNCPVEDDNLVQALEKHPSTQGNETTFPVELRVDPLSGPLYNPSTVQIYINGQYLPEISMQPEEWKRFRYLNAIPNNMVELIVPSSACEMVLLAWDGIYVDSPVKKSVVILPPGGRADVAVRCLEVGVHFLEIESSSSRNHLLGKMRHHRVPSQRIVSLRVVGKPNVPKMILPTHLPPRPTYMQDLLHIDPLQVNKSSYNYEFSVWMDHHSNQMMLGVNQQIFDPLFVNHTMRVDRLEEWELSVNTYCLHHHTKSQHIHMTTHCHAMPHPFHIHGTHFQITRMDTNLDPGGLLFRIGEWRDTIPLFETNVQIRFIPTSYMIGKILTHCHFAAHSDNGMAQLVEVVE